MDMDGELVPEALILESIKIRFEEEQRMEEMAGLSRLQSIVENRVELLSLYEVERAKEL